MIKISSIYILKFFDFFHKKKIINFMKKEKFSNIEIFFDIGGHVGESIELFCSNFNIKNIYSFEASHINFSILKKKENFLKKKFKNTSINIYNLAAGPENKELYLKQLEESSSSTILEINENSKYFKKKQNFLYSNKNFFENLNIKQVRLDNFMDEKSIKKIDFLKLDTEGYEFYILEGLGKFLQDTRYIMFEHHYHDMLIKKYKFSDIDQLLKKKKFKQIFKAKMPFRKTFEYIYKNKIFL